MTRNSEFARKAYEAKYGEIDVTDDCDVSDCAMFETGWSAGRAAERTSFAEECVKKLTAQKWSAHTVSNVGGVQTTQLASENRGLDMAITIISRLAQERGGE